MQQFVDAAGTLLDEDVELHRYDTIQLHIFLANSVEDPEDTRRYYHPARTEYAWRNFTIKTPRTRIVQLRICAPCSVSRAVVEAERAEAERAEKAERAVEAEVIGEDTLEDIELSVDSADDRDNGEDTSRPWKAMLSL